MTFSVITPHWSYNEQADEMLLACHASLGPVHERIIIVNEPAADGSVRFSTYLNIGFRIATGDFMLAVNNDTVLETGTIDELADANAVTSPVVNGLPTRFWGCFFCLPRSIYERVGGLDENYTGYFEDCDWFLRLRCAGVKFRSVPHVGVRHLGGQSMRQLQASALYRLNGDRFRARWGRDAPSVEEMEILCQE